MKDFTQGSITKALLGMALPVVMTNLLHTAYQLTDTFWVGRLGDAAVAAVSLSFPVIFLLMSLGTGFSMAGTILVAQYKGGKNQEMIEHVTAQTIVSSFLLSVILAAIGYLLAPQIIASMTSDPEISPLSIDYLRYSAIGVVFMFGFFVFQSLLRGVGEVSLPMKVVGFTVILNFFLDPLLINGWGGFEGYGVSGAALATIATQGLAMIIGMVILIGGKNGIKLTFRKFKFDLPLLGKMLKLGLPSSIDQSMKALGFTIMTFLVAAFGKTVIAAYGVGFRLLSFVIIPAFGLSIATSTLVGQNIGAQKPERAEKIALKSAQIAFLTLCLMGMIFFVFAEQLVGIFIADSPEVVELGAFYLKFLSVAFGFIGLQLTLNGVYMGSGNTTVSMLFSIISLWCLEFPLAYLLSRSYLGSTGLWVSAPIAAVVITLASFVYFKMGRWKKTRLIENSEQALETKVAEESMIEEGFS
jgi:putative MATE family efflux protein